MFPGSLPNVFVDKHGHLVLLYTLPIFSPVRTVWHIYCCLGFPTLSMIVCHDFLYHDIYEVNLFGLFECLMKVHSISNLAWNMKWLSLSISITASSLYSKTVQLSACVLLCHALDCSWLSIILAVGVWLLSWCCCLIHLLQPYNFHLLHFLLHDSPLVFAQLIVRLPLYGLFLYCGAMSWPLGHDAVPVLTNPWR